MAATATWQSQRTNEFWTQIRQVWVLSHYEQFCLITSFISSNKETLNHRRHHLNLAHLLTWQSTTQRYKVWDIIIYRWMDYECSDFFIRPCIAFSQSKLTPSLHESNGATTFQTSIYIQRIVYSEQLTNQHNTSRFIARENYIHQETKFWFRKC